MEIATPVANAPMENLPAEIRRQLLLAMGLDELSALIHASPVFYQQFRLDRVPILRSALAVTLGSAAVDACALHRAPVFGSLPPNDAQRPEAVSRFLETYRAQCSGIWRPLSVENLTREEVVSMAAFHRTYIAPIAREYARWALSNLSKSTGADDRHHEPLSRFEETRITRALYRLDLACRLFGSRGRNAWALEALEWGDTEHRELACLPNAMEPWEVEQLASVYYFADDKYDQALRHLQYYETWGSPRWKNWPRVGDLFILEMNDRLKKDGIRPGLIAHGLELLHAVLFNSAGNHQRLEAAIRHERQWPPWFGLEQEWDRDAQLMRRIHRPSERDAKQARREPLLFRGDGEPQDDGAYPPWAWTLIWQGRYSNRYGEFIPASSRQWGYIMWDATRLERTGAWELPLREWQESWGTTDPLTLRW